MAYTWQPYVMSGKAAPTSPISLRDQFGDILNQGVINDCTAIATLELFAWLRKTEGFTYEIFGPLSEFYASRQLYGQEIGDSTYVTKNQGVTEDDALEVLIDDGVVPMARDMWSQIQANWVAAYKTAPDPSWWDTSIKLQREQVYKIVPDTHSFHEYVLDALAQGFPVLVSTLVYPSFELLPLNGYVPMPSTNEKPLGGHELLIIEWDPTANRYLYLNSWGPTWGVQLDPKLNGCGWVPEQYVDQYTFEAFIFKPIPKGSDIVQPDPNLARGIDVYEGMGKIDWPTVAKSSIAVAIVKAMEGATLHDKQFAANYKGAKDAGILRGAYQFACPKTSAADAEARAFVSAVQAQGGFDQLPPFLDVEEGGIGNLDAKTLTDWVLAWFDTVRSLTGLTGVLYTDKNTLSTRLQADRLVGIPLWIANYSVAGPGVSDWKFWQYSDKGKVAGIATAVDLNVFNGTVADLNAWATEVSDVKTTKVNVNGQEFAAVVVGNDTYILWTELETLPGFSKQFVNGEWHFAITVPDMSQVKALIQQVLNIL